MLWNKIRSRMTESDHINFIPRGEFLKNFKI